MSTQPALDVASVLIGKDLKLKELKPKGLGPDPGSVGSWALGWSHYVLAGDGKTPAVLDPAGMATIKGVKIGPENTVQDLVNALNK